jgi:hypothetical protein
MRSSGIFFTYGLMRCVRQLRRFAWLRTLPIVLAITHTGTRFVRLWALPSLRFSGSGLFLANLCPPYLDISLPILNSAQNFFQLSVGYLRGYSATLGELYELDLDLFGEFGFGSANVCQPATRIRRQYLLQRELLLNIVLSA